jgi:flagellar protein FlaG
MAIEQAVEFPAATRATAAASVRPASERNAPAPPGPAFRFWTDRETGKTVISVLDSETREVIRQIPPEEILAIARAIGRMRGFFFDDEA